MNIDRYTQKSQDALLAAQRLACLVPALVVVLTWRFALLVAVRLSQARAQKGLREQTTQIRVASI